MGTRSAQLASMALLLAAATGCWTHVEREMAERLDGMEGHLTGLFDAADAVQAGDDGAYREAMGDLHKGGELPGVDAAALGALHASAKQALHARGKEDQASAITSVASKCAACHSARGVPAADLGGDDTLKLGLAALIWQDEPTWQRAVALQPSLKDSPDWPTRSAAVAAALSH
jgi:cytochrome c553